MRTLEITLTEDQYKHIQEEIRYQNRAHLSEGVFGGYELCLSIGIPDIFPASLEIKTKKSIDIGEVEWKFLKKEL